MTHDTILTLNVGSSTLKYALFAVDVSSEPLLRETLEHHDLSVVREKLANEWPQVRIRAVGHRLVHGGKIYSEPVVLDETVLTDLEALKPLAPLHLPPELDAIRQAQSVFSGTHIACFDTAFHRTQLRLATLFAIPRALSDEGMIRYGFHGLSYAYIAGQLPRVTEAKRVIVAHLGNGASMCAMQHGESVATSMGFSALDGLMMGTRCGAIDPGVLLYLLEERGWSAAEVNTMLSRQSGLLGVSGISHDVRELERSDAPEAREALDLFCYRAACEAGRLAVALGGLDALVFTAGIGENSAGIRAGICQHLACMGVTLNAQANDTHASAIHAEDSAIELWVMPTDEECTIAQHCIDVLDKEAS